MTDVDALVAWLRDAVAAKRAEALEQIDMFEMGPWGFVLAQCDATEKILDLMARLHTTEAAWGIRPHVTDAYEDVVKILAVAFADCPGYRDEWRPS